MEGNWLISAQLRTGTCARLSFKENSCTIEGFWEQRLPVHRADILRYHESEHIMQKSTIKLDRWEIQNIFKIKSKSIIALLFISWYLSLRYGRHFSQNRSVLHRARSPGTPPPQTRPAQGPRQHQPSHRHCRPAPRSQRRPRCPIGHPWRSC